MRPAARALPLDATARRGRSRSVDAASDALPIARGLLDRAGARRRSDARGGASDRRASARRSSSTATWLYAERMRVLEERFCARVRERLRARRATPTAAPLDARAQRRGRRAARAHRRAEARRARRPHRRRCALITGGPGTGKTTIVVALLRALAWTGMPMRGAAPSRRPPGKAAQRLQRPSPGSRGGRPRSRRRRPCARSRPPRRRSTACSDGRRHERSLRAARERPAAAPGGPRRRGLDDRPGDDGPARSAPCDPTRGSCCSATPTSCRRSRRAPSSGTSARRSARVRLSVNLRVASDPSARRIVDAAQAVNAGSVESASPCRDRARARSDELAFEGVEHLPARWTDVGDALLERWWRERVAAHRRTSSGEVHAHLPPVARASFDEDDAARAAGALRSPRALAPALRHARARLRRRAEDPQRPPARAPRAATTRAGRRRAATAELAPGAPCPHGRNDYERGLYNGDQGLVVRAGRRRRRRAATAEGSSSPSSRAARSLRRLPARRLRDLAPAFAMTVHKAQGSEFDHVALVLPEARTSRSSRASCSTRP